MNSMGTILPPATPSFNPTPGVQMNEPLAETIKREFRKICESRDEVFYLDVQTNRLIESVAEFVQSKKPFLIIYGQMGLGKSNVLQAMRNALKIRGAYTIPDIYGADELRRFGENKNKPCTRNGRTWDGSDWLFGVESLEYIAIDDLGAEIPKTWRDKSGSSGENVPDWGGQQGPLTRILESRFNHDKRMIITTNEEPAFFARFYSERVAERITQDRVAKIVLNGYSFRDPRYTGKERMKRKNLFP